MKYEKAFLLEERFFHGIALSVLAASLLAANFACALAQSNDCIYICKQMIA